MSFCIGFRRSASGLELGHFAGRLFLRRHPSGLFRPPPLSFLCGGLACRLCLGSLAGRLFLGGESSGVLRSYSACGIFLRRAQCGLELGSPLLCLFSCFPGGLELGALARGFLVGGLRGPFCLARDVFRLFLLCEDLGGFSCGLLVRRLACQLLRCRSGGFELGCSAGRLFLRLAGRFGCLLTAPIQDFRSFRCGRGDGTPGDLCREGPAVRRCATVLRLAIRRRIRSGSAGAFRNIALFDCFRRLDVVPIHVRQSLRSTQGLGRDHLVERKWSRARKSGLGASEETTHRFVPVRHHDHRAVPGLVEILGVCRDFRIRQGEMSDVVSEIPAYETALPALCSAPQCLPCRSRDLVSLRPGERNAGSTDFADQHIAGSAVRVLTQVSGQQSKRAFVFGRGTKVVEKGSEGRLRDEYVVGWLALGCRASRRPSDAPQQWPRRPHVESLDSRVGSRRSGGRALPPGVLVCHLVSQSA